MDEFTNDREVCEYYAPLYEQLRSRQQQEREAFNAANPAVVSLFDGTASALRIRQFNEYLALVEQEQSALRKVWGIA